MGELSTCLDGRPFDNATSENLYWVPLTPGSVKTELDTTPGVLNVPVVKFVRRYPVGCVIGTSHTFERYNPSFVVLRFEGDEMIVFKPTLAVATSPLLYDATVKA
jgi:hypothetical protein